MGAAVRDRRLLEHDLRNAIPRDELRLVYQPQKDINGGKVIGFEALLRWKHPTRGDIPPSEFIPIAENTGSFFRSASGFRGRIPRGGHRDITLDRRRKCFRRSNPQRKFCQRGA